MNGSKEQLPRPKARETTLPRGGPRGRKERGKGKGKESPRGKEKNKEREKAKAKEKARRLPSRQIPFTPTREAKARARAGPNTRKGQEKEGQNGTLEGKAHGR